MIVCVSVCVCVCVCNTTNKEELLSLQSTGLVQETRMSFLFDLFRLLHTLLSFFSNLFYNNIYLVTAVLITDDFCSLSPIPISLSFSFNERQIVLLAFSDVVINEKGILRPTKDAISGDGQYAKKQETQKMIYRTF